MNENPPARSPASPADLFARFDALGIKTVTHDHPPLHTVEESKRLRGSLPGGHCKSLFLRDKRRNLWLVVTLEDRAVDLKALRHRLGAASTLSFASPELLLEVLGVIPGAVTPFGLINDTQHRAAVVLDRAMLAHDPLNYHPLTNDKTTAIAPGDLVKFIQSCGQTPAVMDLGNP